MSKHEEAVAEASRALSDDPTYTKAYERRAASLYDTGESIPANHVQFVCVCHGATLHGTG